MHIYFFIWSILSSFECAYFLTSFNIRMPYFAPKDTNKNFLFLLAPFLSCYFVCWLYFIVFLNTKAELYFANTSGMGQKYCHTVMYELFIESKRIGQLYLSNFSWEKELNINMNSHQLNGIARPYGIVYHHSRPSVWSVKNYAYIIYRYNYLVMVHANPARWHSPREKNWNRGLVYRRRGSKVWVL